MSDALEAAKQEAVRAKTTAKDAVETVKREAERTKTTLQDTFKEIKTAVDWVGGGPASSPDEAERQIAELRSRLERDLRTLRARVPDPSAISDRSRRMAGAVGAGAVTISLGIASIKKRGARRDQQRRFRDEAILIARELAKIDLERIADEVAAEFEDVRGGRNRGRVILALLGIVGGFAASWWARQREIRVAGELDARA